MNIKPTIVGLSLATIFSATLEAGPKWLRVWGGIWSWLCISRL